MVTDHLDPFENSITKRHGDMRNLEESHRWLCFLGPKAK